MSTVNIEIINNSGISGVTVTLSCYASSVVKLCENASLPITVKASKEICTGDYGGHLAFDINVYQDGHEIAVSGSDVTRDVQGIEIVKNEYSQPVPEYQY